MTFHLRRCSKRPYVSTHPEAIQWVAMNETFTKQESNLNKESSIYFRERALIFAAKNRGKRKKKNTKLFVAFDFGMQLSFSK